MQADRETLHISLRAGSEALQQTNLTVDEIIKTFEIDGSGFINVIQFCGVVPIDKRSIFKVKISLQFIISFLFFFFSF